MTRLRSLFALLVFALAVHAQLPRINAELARTFRGHEGPLRDVAFSPDARLLATGGVDGMVRLWRLGDFKLDGNLSNSEGLTSTAFSPDGQWLACASYDATVKLWRVRDRKLVRTLTGPVGTVWTVAFSPDSQRLAAAGEDRKIRIWRASDGALLRTLAGHALNIWSIAFSPDGRSLASGSFDRTARIWSVDSGKLLRTLTAHEQAIVALAFSPDGRSLATGGDDSTVRLWRTSDWQLTKTIDATNHVYGVAFSPDSQWLAGCGRERSALGAIWSKIAGDPEEHGVTVRVWRVRDGALQQSLAEQSVEVRSVEFSSDGKWLAAGSEDSTVKLWRLTVR